MSPRAIFDLLQRAATVPGLRAAVYIAEAARYRVRAGGGLAFGSVQRHYADWRDDQVRRQSPLVRRIPWLTFGAIRFLDANLRSDSRVFEFGSGGSTLFFGQRAQHVVSVEHDAAWSARVRDAVAELRLTNCTLLTTPPTSGADASGDPTDPDAYLSTDPLFAGKSFHAYASTIDQYDDESFDLILIDGRARPSCGKHAIPKLARGGLLVLDNAERSDYARIAAMTADRGWRRRDFVGPGPVNRYFWMTSAWKRPA